MVTLQQINDGRARHGLPPIVLPDSPKPQKEVQQRPKAAKQKRVRVRTPAPKRFWLIGFLRGLLWMAIIAVCGVIAAILTLMTGKVHKR